MLNCKNNQKYIAILSSAYRKLKQPTESLKLSTDDSRNTAVLASRAAAYLDLGDLDNADLVIRRAYGFDLNNKNSQSYSYIQKVFCRLDKMKQYRKN